MARSFRDTDWETLETLRKIEAEIHRAEQLGGTFSCESASDLLEIARHLRLFGISNRHDALLTYYCQRVECENGAATELDWSVAYALLSLSNGAEPAKILTAITTAITAWQSRHPEVK